MSEVWATRSEAWQSRATHRTTAVTRSHPPLRLLASLSLCWEGLDGNRPMTGPHFAQESSFYTTHGASCDRRSSNSPTSHRTLALRQGSRQPLLACREFSDST